MTTAAPARRFTGDFRADVLVLAVAALALIGAWVYQRSLAAETSRFTDSNSGLTLDIPDNWTVNESQGADDFVSAYNTRADSIFKSTITGRSFALDPDAPASLDSIVDTTVQDRQATLLAFHLFSTQPTTIGGADARAIQYAYVTEPIDQAFAASAPVVVIATDYILYSPAREYWVLSLAADEKIADREAADFAAILQSIKLPAQ